MRSTRADIRAFVPISIALTTTALGTLVPILRDGGESRLPIGRAVFANGAIGEMFPVIGISLFLSSRGIWAALGLLIAFGVAAFALARIVTQLREHRIAAWIRSGSETSSQTMVRLSVLLLIALLAVAARFGLDVVLGAFAAGIVLRVALPEGDAPLELKLDGLGYGFFIPAFFVVSGMNLDVASDPARPASHARVFRAHPRDPRGAGDSAVLALATGRPGDPPGALHGP